uniref:Uncharacterized protein n=1 Tax=Oscillatoriales cyanobacterium SpSt-402 TaxID=2282168 RepID=A0A832M5C5_9CYAN
MGQNHPLKDKSKFYDLFRHNIYALKPYSPDDAFRMLKHLNEVAGNPLSDTQLNQIHWLAGGHARLLKIIFNIWVQEGKSGIMIEHFKDKPDVQQECQRILRNLHEDEQEVALLAARRLHVAEHPAILDHLERRGVLVRSDPVTWFSPLMGQFLRTYDKEAT